MKERERWLTFEERAVWGECPACKAKDGEPCVEDGIEMFFRSSNAIQVHLGRITEAPRKIREVAIL